MILKIRNKNPDKGISWKVIGEIKEIDYEYMSLVDAEELAKCYSCNQYYYRHFEISDEKNKRVCFINIYKNDGTTLVITTDDTVYILNDGGKTVDGVYL